jgi:hypothetical protein
MAAQEEEIITTLSIKSSTKSRLLEIGKMNESYDDLLNRMLDELKKKVPK